jgi:integrase
MNLPQFFEEVYRPLKLRNRSANTIRLYRFSIRCFGQTLGREARLEDLTDDTVSAHLARLVADKRSPYTVNKERSQLLALWNYAARKGFVSVWPDVEPEIAPKRVPVAWVESELHRLVDSCRLETGLLAGVPADIWWVALHQVCWDTGERIGAVRQLTWGCLNAEGWLIVRAEFRKGKREDKRFLLGRDTMDTLSRLASYCAGYPIQQQPELPIFPWPYSQTYLYHRYRRILQRAGLPCDRTAKFHRLRRTAASYFELGGGNATDLLGHTSREVTKRYIDPRIVPQQQPCEVLFRI